MLLCATTSATDRGTTLCTIHGRTGRAGWLAKLNGARVNSPQSNGMAESFVNKIKRDCVGCMDRTNGATVLAQLPGAFRHFNEVHPHSALG